ncbi:MAG TPA: CDP-diacylglycerol--glycerol-3-phosphate 3-phosphatidyltransferase [Methylococcales bacterium]|jgi:CDP-diacylglycerol--glycerol-3-phosphate 3-phosphatidyltransferase|nr:CDP-diacylglycerol--glycerol-3-phosphate 3-phosphatidyltransferase [Methylococcales bacterium]
MVEYNIPTLLTFTRIALTFLIVIVFYLPWEYSNIACMVIFSIAGFTDWLDGHLARKMGQHTNFGAFLDPVADKLLVVLTLVIIIETESSIFMTIPAAIIIGRELVISALREWMASSGQRDVVAVSNLGKWKTGTQMVAIGCLLFSDDLLFLPVSTLGYLLLYIAAVITVVSMYQYLSAVFGVNKDNSEKVVS